MRKNEKANITIRKKVVGMIIFVMLLCAGCGKEKNVEQVSKTEKSNSLKEVEQVENNVEENPICFDTEYTIEDYCNGVFIVSKSNGLLYGALNVKGEEIIPVKYDEMEFMNEEEIAENDKMNVYIQTRFEDVWTIMDETGKECLESNTKFRFSSPILVENAKNDLNTVPYFYEWEPSSVRFYNGLGKIISEVDFDVQIFMADVTWITSEYFLLQTGYSTEEFDAVASLGYYKRDGSLVKQWESAIINSEHTENEFTFWTKDWEHEEICKNVINNSGNINELERMNTDDYVTMEQNHFTSGVMNHMNGTETYELSNGIELFHSNGTWKLCDASGKALYDERYFDCKSQGELYFLQNEDFEVLVIDSAGEKVIDYGMITYNNAGETYCFKGMELDWKSNYFADKHSICFVTEGNEGMSKVYCYGGK